MVFPWKDLCRRLTAKHIANVVIDKAGSDNTSKADPENSETKMIQQNGHN